MKKIALHGSFSQNMVDCLQKKCPEGFEVYAISPENEAADLEKADYIVNRGAVVNTIDRKFVRDIFEMRRLLESEAVARAAGNGMETGRLLERLYDLRDHITEVSRSAYELLNQDIHTAIWTAAGNHQLQKYLMEIWNGPSVAGSAEDILDIRPRGAQHHHRPFYRGFPAAVHQHDELHPRGTFIDGETLEGNRHPQVLWCGRSRNIRDAYQRGGNSYRIGLGVGCFAYFGQQQSRHESVGHFIYHYAHRAEYPYHRRGHHTDFRAFRDCAWSALYPRSRLAGHS